MGLDIWGAQPHSVSVIKLRVMLTRLRDADHEVGSELVVAADLTASDEARRTEAVCVP